MFFVHLGAGVGDQDKKTNFRCGFTEFIKKNYNTSSNAFIVEANPANIDKLKISYKNFKNVKIFNYAISSKDINNLTMYYAVEDFPHYQVCSSDKNHVKKHYPNSEIKNFSIETLSINSFLEKNSLFEIDYLSIDIEGLDYDVLMSIDFSKFNIKNISIEYIHLSRFQKKKFINFLKKNGYSYCGFGYDHNNFDFLFKKKKILWNNFFSKTLYLISTKHYKFFNFLFINKKKN